MYYDAVFHVLSISGVATGQRSDIDRILSNHRPQYRYPGTVFKKMQSKQWTYYETPRGLKSAAVPGEPQHSPPHNHARYVRSRECAHDQGNPAVHHSCKPPRRRGDRPRSCAHCPRTPELTLGPHALQPEHEVRRRRRRRRRRSSVCQP